MKKKLLAFLFFLALPLYAQYNDSPCGPDEDCSDDSSNVAPPPIQPNAPAPMPANGNPQGKNKGKKKRGGGKKKNKMQNQQPQPQQPNAQQTKDEEEKEGAPDWDNGPRDNHSEEEWEEKQDLYNQTLKKGTPMVYSARALEKLNLKSSLCPEFQSKLESCSYFRCIRDLRVVGAKVGADLIVHGANSAGNCAVTLPFGERYFVPRPDLKSFFELIQPSLDFHNPQTSFTLTVRTKVPTKETKELTVKGKTCVVELEYLTKIEKKNLVQSAASTLNQFPDADLSRKVIIDGQSFFPKSNTEKIISSRQYKKIGLKKGSPSECSEYKATLLFDLESKGLKEEVEPVEIK